MHTKIYLWEKDRKPFRAYTGSANYTQPAFFGKHREAMSGCDSDFFPERGAHFTVITDDGKSLILCRVQDNGKGIKAPSSNAQIGEYLRMRLGLPNGAFVEKEDLERYGRTDIVFYKLDDEQYYMDFSRHEGGD